MTGREMILAAFSSEGTPAFAAMTAYQDICLRDHWDDATDEPWHSAFSADPAVAARPLAQMVERTGEDVFLLPFGHSRGEQADLSIEADADGVWQVRRSTGERRRLERSPIAGDFIAMPDGEAAAAAHVRSIVELDALLDRTIGPSGDARDTGLADGALDLPRALIARLGAQKVPMAHVACPLWQCFCHWGLTGAMRTVIEAPELIERACERFVESTVRRIRHLAEAGAVLIWIEDCWTDMMSPAHFRRLNVPFMRDLTDEVRAHGMYSIHYYCGQPEDRWGLLLDTGADALALEEGKKGFRADIAEAAEVCDGRMALLGNPDAIGVLEHGSEDDLRRELLRQHETGRRNHDRFIFSIGSPVTPGTPLSRVRRYCDLAHEIGAL